MIDHEGRTLGLKIYYAIVGENNSNEGVLRSVIAIGVFVAIGGTIFWAIR